MLHHEHLQIIMENASTVAQQEQQKQQQQQSTGMTQNGENADKDKFSQES